MVTALHRGMIWHRLHFNIPSILAFSVLTTRVVLTLNEVLLLYLGWRCCYTNKHLKPISKPDQPPYWHEVISFCGHCTLRMADPFRHIQLTPLSSAHHSCYVNLQLYLSIIPNNYIFPPLNTEPLTCSTTIHVPLSISLLWQSQRNIYHRCQATIKSTRTGTASRPNY